jgi:hypothetical protein
MDHLHLPSYRANFLFPIVVTFLTLYAGHQLSGTYRNRVVTFQKQSKILHTVLYFLILFLLLNSFDKTLV